MKKKIGFVTASAIVVANMIGTGVFTSVGFQLDSALNSWTILFYWLAGGILALFGAFAYAELGTQFPESGGDYVYLSRLIHPVFGYLTAWAGLTVGFSAPVALAAMAFTKYLAPFGLQGNAFLAIAMILVIGLMHSFSIKSSSRFHNYTTGVKILFISVLIIAGLILPGKEGNALRFDDSWKTEIFQPSFAISMIYVSFAYTGWNAAAYVTGEIDNPSRNMPKALLGSTLFVALLYLLFQYVLLKNGSVEELRGKEEVTFVSFTNLFGTTGGKWVSVFIAIQLVATISSYLWVGPRVTAALGKEFRLWRLMGRKNANGIPVVATWAHVIVSIALALSGKFEQVLVYAGFVLQLMSMLTVASSLRVKKKAPGNFKSPFKPWLQIIFLLFNTWVLVYTAIERPLESLIGLGIMLTGLLIYLFDKRMPISVA